MSKKALITGITGQDGSFLAEFLLGKGYEVHCLLYTSTSGVYPTVFTLILLPPAERRLEMGCIMEPVRSCVRWESHAEITGHDR